MKNNKLKLIPDFKTEDDERNFWDTADMTEYFDTDNPVDMDLSQLKPSTESISLRIPSSMLMRIKQIANSRDVPYQSLMKIFLAKQIQEELHAQRSTK
ncbi:hypothetical protein COU87_00505 [Candidatus Roizmanbacteria bacterium CG10_big_fil_rev_8_21_14_0_10_39_12]|uniref:Uncharacterized protein n=1 Tax=Candidatus Roizmanbacteria bacterium CG10_big_fil_rev_8_21_14_0_10_39_12 TaxID=1974852 RepID=A0A2M8KQL4_9BACT|nr:MAG: hypothetical protein COU87_00505 [Candidatus Roizmanbacteria bacterium CG10_big_fil_rev_8_21_14_0_10_39_12]